MVRRWWLAAVLILSAIAYARSLGAGWIYDDHAMVADNRHLEEWSFLWKAFTHDSWWYQGPGIGPPPSAYYRPLQLAWFEINFRLFGLNTVAWHAAMIALQVVVVWLVFRVTEELTEGDLGSAVVSALIFSLMPIHAQAVAWVSAVPLPMAAAFELAALLAIARHGTSSTRSAALSLGFFGLALLSHESAISFPAVVAAYVFIAPRPGGVSDERTWPQRIRTAAVASAPFFALAVIYLGIRYLVLGLINREADTHLSATTVFFTLPEIAADYLLMLIAPLWAEPGHTVVPIHGIVSARLWVTLAGLSAFAALAFVSLRRRSRARLYLFCGAWGAIAILPMMNIIAFRPISLVEDRYLYATSAAYCVLIGALAGELIAERGTVRKVVLAGVAAASALLAVRLWIGQQFFIDDLATFSRCVQEAPGSWLCREWLGKTLRAKGDLLGADEQYSSAVRIDPEPNGPRYNLGMVHFEEGDGRPALFEMLEALRKTHHLDPALYSDLIRVSIGSGHEDIAEQVVQLADTHKSTKPTAALGRAEIQVARHDKPGAVAILKDATTRFPDDGDIWILLSGLYTDLGNLPEATDAAGRAVASEPNAGWFRMVHAKLLDRMGQHEEALAEYRNAIKAEPNDPKIREKVAQVAPEAIR